MVLTEILESMVLSMPTTVVKEAVFRPMLVGDGWMGRLMVLSLPSTHPILHHRKKFATNIQV